MGFDKAKIISAAEKYLAQGKIPSAIGEYRRIVERDPNDYSALNTLGDLYARTKKTQDAVDCFQRVADHYREQGFTLKAIAIYKKISRLAPDLPAIAQRLALLYEQQGHFVEAREQYLLIADAYARSGQMRDSLAALRRIADLDPNNVDIRLRLGQGFLREDLREEAADAFTEAGERLLARHDAAPALKAYAQAHELRPLNHAALHGLAAAYTELGSADEAAAVLEEAVAVEPQDVELRVMLTRAYIVAEDAPAAERATEGLVEIDKSSYPLLFEVTRLYLQRGDTGGAVRALARATEPALAGRQDQMLLELLNEALARDPEQLDALRLLLRIYTWQRDDDRMRVTLERLAEVAQTHHLVDEERRALEHLVRLVPFDQSYYERLHDLGEAPAGFREELSESPPVKEKDAAPPSEEVPVFESVIERGDAFSIDPSITSNDSGGGASEFEWNSVAMPEVTLPEPPIAPDPSSSFADLNEDFADAAPGKSTGASRKSTSTTFDVAESLAINSFDEVAFALDAPPEAQAGASDERGKILLMQELESVDYYLAQGYMDIARDTLDMLERQYGAGEEIDARRRQLPPGGLASAPVVIDDNGAAREADAPAGFETFAQFEFTPPVEAEATEEIEIGDQLFVTPAEAATDDAAPHLDAPQIVMHGHGDEAQPTASPATPAPRGLHPELADMFDEFRDEVEAGTPASGGDYETHFNTGIAYREMGLVDQAVEELQAAIALIAPQDGTPRYLQCCNLLGHCFMQKGMPHPAAMWFKKGLHAPGHTEDEYQALRYELGAAYEEMGDLERAIETFSEVYGTDVNYRGVAAKLRDLQAQKAVTSDK